MTKHVRLPGYSSSDLDRLSYSNGDIVNDTNNVTIRLMDGVTPGGWKLATEAWVQVNAITSANLADNLTTALQPYALTADLAPYALTADVNSAIAAIPIYTLPAATTGLLGGVKVDGTSITVDPDGTIHGSNQYSLPTAGVGVGGALGGVKVDGTTITISNGVISGANTYTLPTAGTSTKGGVIIPAVATSGITNTSGTIGLATATTSQLGGVKVDGTSITINNGVISGASTYTLPAATTTTLGGVIVPAVANSGLTNASGTIRLATATTSQLGGVKVDGSTILINGNGVISATITGAIVFQGGWNANTNSPTLNNSSGAYNTNGFEFVCTTAGTVNFGAGNVTFAVGDNVIYNGTTWVKVPIGSSAGTTNALLTFDTSGTGGNSGSTFNGSSALTISYNTIGASPLAGSSSITTVGIIASGTWNGSLVNPTYGGTGVNNGSYTLTISGGSRTLDQDVSSSSSPTFTATNFSGTASSLSIGGSAASATTAGSATTATNIAGGAANRIIVQTGTGTTGFVVAPTVASTYLQWNGSAFIFSTVTGASGGTVTSVGGTGTVNGLTLTGTVTSSGNLTLGGTLSLVSPPAIGSTSPNTGAFTTLTCTSNNFSVNLSPTGTGSVSINPGTAGTINNMSIGATTATTGRFTTITSTQATGVAPFTVASTTNVANLNASSLSGATFASPGVIGGTTPNTISTTQLGYLGSGTGGTVTQLIARTSTVVLNTITGTITLVAAVATAGATTQFTFTNSNIAATDHVIMTHQSGGTGGIYNITVFPGAGTATVYITNVSTTNSASESPVLKFTVIKSVNA